MQCSAVQCGAPCGAVWCGTGYSKQRPASHGAERDGERPTGFGGWAAPVAGWTMMGLGYWRPRMVAVCVGKSLHRSCTVGNCHTGSAYSWPWQGLWANQDTEGLEYLILAANISMIEVLEFCNGQISILHLLQPSDVFL